MWSVLERARSTRRSFAARLVLPFATMVLALLFLSHHGVVVEEAMTEPGPTVHATASSGGGSSGHAFGGMEAEHGDYANATHSDCVPSNTGCLNAKTELGLPAPLSVGGVLLRPVPLQPPPLLAHSPPPQPPQLSELSILRI